MNVTTKHVTPGIAALLAITLLPAPARADGGIVLTRENQGPFVITIFAPPDVTAAAMSDLGVLVQSRDSGEILLDAAVDLTLTPPEHGHWLSSGEIGGSCAMTAGAATSVPGQPFSLPATTTHAANKLLHGASVVLPATGSWQLSALVRRGNAQASVTCTLTAGEPRRRVANLWPYLALPFVAIVLFAMNQWLRGRS